MKPLQDNAPGKEVPTLRAFASRFLDGYARQNRQKPSGIAAKEMILRVHLVPTLGHKKIDAIKKRRRATSQGPPEHEGGEDGEQHPDGAERDAEEGGGMECHRPSAMCDQAVARLEELDSLLRLRGIRAPDCRCTSNGFACVLARADGGERRACGLARWWRSSGATSTSLSARCVCSDQPGRGTSRRRRAAGFGTFRLPFDSQRRCGITVTSAAPSRVLKK